MIVVAIIALIIAIAVPSFLGTNAKVQRVVCIDNLRHIDEAKELWAIQNLAASDVIINMSDLVPVFIKKPFTCPGGGTYTVGNIDTLPTCGIAGHTLAGE